MKRNGGYTLVEVMVAMVISLIVLGGVYKAVTDETVMLERDEAVLDLQNNARVAMERLVRDIRRTGFFGCGGVLSYPATNTMPDPIEDFVNDDSTTTNNIDDGTDSITFNYLDGDVPV
ncbi:MAG: PilW family protein, partial [Desulfurivibrionaceae bacterium]